MNHRRLLLPHHLNHGQGDLEVVYPVPSYWTARHIREFIFSMTLNCGIGNISFSSEEILNHWDHPSTTDGKKTITEDPELK